ncbi:TPA: hypothetical protein EYO12_04015 [Candidatus Saccharibacteria bacterium]|nr:hypothetical protein [Candidatus Saccharibacteria bacterium]HIO87799.1 hypothetical protein [Candidatus Saccharibacteria bacterium]
MEQLPAPSSEVQNIIDSDNFTVNEIDAFESGAQALSESATPEDRTEAFQLVVDSSDEPDLARFRRYLNARRQDDSVSEQMNAAYFDETSPPPNSKLQDAVEYGESTVSRKIDVVNKTKDAVKIFVDNRGIVHSNKAEALTTERTYDKLAH